MPPEVVAPEVVAIAHACKQISLIDVNACSSHTTFPIPDEAELEALMARERRPQHELDAVLSASHQMAEDLPSPSKAYGHKPRRSWRLISACCMMVACTLYAHLRLRSPILLPRVPADELLSSETDDPRRWWIPAARLHGGAAPWSVTAATVGTTGLRAAGPRSSGTARGSARPRLCVPSRSTEAPPGRSASPTWCCLDEGRDSGTA